MIHNKRGFQFKNALCREFQLTNPLEIAILALEKNMTNNFNPPPLPQIYLLRLGRLKGRNDKTLPGMTREQCDFEKI